MKSNFWFSCVFVLLILVANRAEAVIQQLDPIDGYDCAGGMTTTNCFTSPTGTGWSGPATTACYAQGRNAQRCKSCEEDYYPNGQPTGYSVCKFVPRDAACDCTFTGPNSRKCTGNTASVCQYSW